MVAEHINSSQDEKTKLVKSYGIKAYACHPLTAEGGKVIGTLSFGTSRRETFSESDLSFMKAVTNHAAVAIAKLNYEKGLDDLARYPRENPSPVMRVSKNGVLLYANESSSILLEKWGCKTGYMVPGNVADMIRECLVSRKNQHFETDVGDITYTLEFVPIREEGFVNIYGKNITELKEREKDLLRINRVLQALGGNSRSIISATEESEYLDAICNIIVRDCGYAMVWVGYAVEDEEKSIWPAAYAGFEQGYLDTLNLTWADAERGRGPIGTAIRTGQISICRNIKTDPNFAPWREEALKRGYASCIVIPLTAYGKTFGAISIYSQSIEVFADTEKNLLAELANDTAHGIHTIRLRVEHTKSEKALRESEEKFKLIATNTPDHIFIQDTELRYAWVVNPQLGLSETDMIGKTDLDILSRSDADELVKLKRKVIETGIREYVSVPLTSRDGSVQFFEGSIHSQARFVRQGGRHHRIL